MRTHVVRCPCLLRSGGYRILHGSASLLATLVVIPLLTAGLGGTVLQVCRLLVVDNPTELVQHRLHQLLFQAFCFVSELDHLTELDHDTVTAVVRRTDVLAASREFPTDLLREVFGTRPVERNLKLLLIETSAEMLDELLKAPGLLGGTQKCDRPR